MISLSTEICKPGLKLDFMAHGIMGVPLRIWTSNFTGNKSLYSDLDQNVYLGPDKAVAVQ
jgi:hypothetical protein